LILHGFARLQSKDSGDEQVQDSSYMLLEKNVSGVGINEN
jgi:hypothetical protein